MSTTFLYIPFSKDEEPEQLLKSAKLWKAVNSKKYEMKEILASVPEKNIIICTYGDNALKEVKNGDSVYILAHGMPNTTSVAHSNTSDEFTLTQDDVAKRSIEDGLPENIAFKLKLFFCDVSDTALERAHQFFNGISKHGKDKNFNNIGLFYYPSVILFPPEAPKEYHNIHKSYKKATVKQSLLDLEKAQLENQLKQTMNTMSPAQLKSFLGSLGIDILMALIKKADHSLLKSLQEKAEISNINHFLKTLQKDEVYSPVIYKELGKAKDFRKKYTK